LTKGDSKVFGRIGQLAELLRSAGRMQEMLQRFVQALKRIEVEGSAGAGMVIVRMNGLQEALDCKIDPQLFEEKDAELLEELVIAATNQALEKSREAAREEMSRVANQEGLGDLAGLAEMIRQLGMG